MSEVEQPNNYTNRLEDLPIQENFEDENHPNYMTSVVWEPMEHFLHNPERSLSEYNWSTEELKKVNWPAIKIAWQRHLYKSYQREGSFAYTVYLGDKGWASYPTEVSRDYGPADQPEKYDPLRVNNPNDVKTDYHWVRNELISKLGEFNSDNFGLPENLYE